MTQINPRWPYGDGEMAGRIHDFDWSATLLGPVAGWSDRLRMLVEQALASPLVSTLVCGPHHLLIYNDAAAQHFGDHHPAALGRPLPEAFPEGWETVAPYYERAFGGETVRVAGQPLDTRGEGRSTDVFDALLTPMRESDGHIAYVHMTGAEVGDRARIEAALRDSEERYRSVFETLSQAYCEGQVIRSADGKAVDIRYLELNPAWGRFTGVPSAEALGRLAREVTPGIEDWWIETAGRVAATGIAEQVEHELMALDSWFGVSIHPRPGDRYVAIFDDITDRKRQEFSAAVLADIGVDLALLVSPDEIIEAVGTRLGRSLHLSGCIFADVDEAKNEATIHHGWNTADVASLRQTFRLADYFGEEFRRAGRAGETVVVRDTARDQRANAEAYARLRLGSFVTVPFLRQGRWVANITATTREPRDWHNQDIKLLQEIANRVFPRIERARAEAALRESEERFQQFAAASASALWIRDADTLHMEYVSPAIARIFGVEPAAFLDGIELWAASILPEDRTAAMEHLEKARQGEVVVHEFRIQRASDLAFRWIRNSDFPLHDGQGRVQRIGGIAEDITENKLAIEHQSVLLAELQHRVRNIMGMIRSMANRTAFGAEGVDGYRTLLEGRLLALARVQALLTREANAGGSLRSVLENEIAAQAHDSGQYALIGPDIKLSPKAVEVLTLAFHELAANALKYGAFSVPDGRLTVTWALLEKRGSPWLTLDWTEAGAPPRQPSTRKGLGSELIEARIPYELSGSGTITITPEGARCHLEFPLREAESILETDAPQPTTTFGGTLDMTGAPDLTGRTVLVVEDDYYLATDTAAALRGAGAKVLGPCPNEEAARNLLEDALPTHAVLDLNLGGGGPRFEIAQLLKARGIPFMFLTGYDPDVIPADLADIVRLQKPLPFRDIVEAVAQL